MKLQTIFISYDSKDLQIAEKIATKLQEHSLNVWMDRENLQGGHEWESTIKTVIEKEISFFLILISKSSLNNKRFFKVEYELALERLAKGARDFTIIPVCVDDINLTETNLDGELKKLHAIKLSQSGNHENILFALGLEPLRETHPYIEGHWVGYTIEDVSKLGGKHNQVFPCYAELKIVHNIITGFVSVDYRGIGDTPKVELSLHGYVIGNTIMFNWVNRENNQHVGLTTLDILTEELFAGHFNAMSVDARKSGHGKTAFHKVQLNGYNLD